MTRNPLLLSLILTICCQNQSGELTLELPLNGDTAYFIVDSIKVTDSLVYVVLEIDSVKYYDSLVAMLDTKTIIQMDSAPMPVYQVDRGMKIVQQRIDSVSCKMDSIRIMLKRKVEQKNNLEMQQRIP